MGGLPHFWFVAERQLLWLFRNLTVHCVIARWRESLVVDVPGTLDERRLADGVAMSCVRPGSRWCRPALSPGARPGVLVGLQGANAASHGLCVGRWRRCGLRGAPRFLRLC